MTVHPNQTACSVPTVGEKRRKKKERKNWCLSSLNHIPCSSFTALLPVNSANTKAANCCLHNLQPFNSTNPHIGPHEGRGVGMSASISPHRDFLFAFFSLIVHRCACSVRRVCSFFIFLGRHLASMRTRQSAHHCTFFQRFLFFFFPGN